MLAEVITVEWRARLQTMTSLWVGFSGGLDSTVLLHALQSEPSLKSRLRAIHVNHGLSCHAQAWQQHCERVCAQWDIPCVTQAVQLNHATNLEAQARAARLAIFAPYITANTGLVLAHHQQDQAETVLLHLCRGAGVSGLAAMPECLAFQAGYILRPLLQQPKAVLLAYAKAHALSWVEDDSNQATYFSRNYLRHEIMPRLQARWPGVSECVTQAAQHCQQAQSNLRDLAYLDYPELAVAGNRLQLEPLKLLSSARVSNVLRVWLMQHVSRMPSSKTFQRILDEVIAASIDSSPCVAWDDVQIRRYRHTLYLLPQQMPISTHLYWHEFPAPLLAGTQVFHAKPSSHGVYIPEHAPVQLRFRQGGETLVWQGKTRRLKQLWQEWGVPPWLRAHIPLVYVADELAAVMDFCISDSYYKTEVGRTFHITALSIGAI
jgi:tRNA(Ile)-lysidine synthase